MNYKMENKQPDHSKKEEYKPEAKQYQDITYGLIEPNNLRFHFEHGLLERDVVKYMRMQDREHDKSLWMDCVYNMWLNYIIGGYSYVDEEGVPVHIKCILDGDTGKWVLPDKSYKRRQNTKVLRKKFGMVKRSSQMYFTDAFLDPHRALRDFILKKYPDLYDQNPFETPEKFVYPYKNVTLIQLFTLRYFKKSFEMAEWIEKNPMDMPTFWSYVTNEAYSLNEKTGKQNFNVVAVRDSIDIFHTNDPENAAKKRLLRQQRMLYMKEAMEKTKPKKSTITIGKPSRKE